MVPRDRKDHWKNQLLRKMCQSLKGDHRQEASTSRSLVFTGKQTLKGAVLFFGVEYASVGDGIFLRDK